MSHYFLDRYLIEFSCFVAFEKEPISDGSARMSIVEEYDDLVSNNRNRALRDISIFIDKLRVPYDLFTRDK